MSEEQRPPNGLEPTKSAGRSRERSPERIGNYRILKKLGEGGMGQVYLAHDEKLGRKVALKFLAETVRQNAIAEKRFLREARSAAALDHPYICKVYEVGSFEGRDFIAMEHVEGRTLQSLLDEGPVPVDRALEIACEVAEALNKAHRRGIIHRDLKPSNLMVTSEGHVKILDFGLAKPLEIPEGIATEESTVLELTREGTTLGTVPYMSPEQIRGEPLDGRSDLFSFGLMLYEMLTGVHPFRRDSLFETGHAILNEALPPLRRFSHTLPSQLQPLVGRLLAKDLGSRYQSADHLFTDLAKTRSALAVSVLGLRSIIERPQVLVAGVIFVMLAAAVATWSWIRSSRMHWARSEALPRAEALLVDLQFVDAFQLLREIEQVLPDDQTVQALLESASEPMSITTAPQGAAVYIKDYMKPDSKWFYLGLSPLERTRVPATNLRVKIEKKGMQTIEGAFQPWWGSAEFELVESEESRFGMVRLAGREYSGHGLSNVEMGAFWIDEFEVTNGEFKEFVDAGGYRKRELWEHPFVKGEQRLSWEEAMVTFRDVTGQPGPATWKLGTYLEGGENFPVRGISWYESVAYCKYAEKSLPTVHHWVEAAGYETYRVPMFALSNFGSDGPVAVGSLQGVAPEGAYDLAGNVKEWCWTAGDGEKRYIQGGAWNDPPYMMDNDDTRPAMARRETYGFRCAVYEEEVSDELMAPVPEESALDFGARTPVSDEEFQIYKRLYTYDRTALNARIESVDETFRHWTRETVSFDAAYGGERVTAYLFLPREAKPPYETVVYFPGATARQPVPSRNLAEMTYVSFIPRSGRALLYPVYQGTYERFLERLGYQASSATMRDLVIQWAKDLRRSIDYLETRPDIDSERLAFLGLSLGGAFGPLMTVVEDRFQTSVLLAGGLYYPDLLPEVDPLNFAPRVDTPTLMINGRYDTVLGYESSQVPLFQLLGSSDKKHAVLEGQHLPPMDKVIRETLEWLDEHLGPVQR